MKSLILTVLFSLCLSGVVQADSFSEEHFKVSGVNFKDKKTNILKKFGVPKSTYNPNYDCGFLSDNGVDLQFESLDYGSFKFTGNNNYNYTLERIDIVKMAGIDVTYKNNKLTNKTTINELVSLFGNDILKNLDEDSTGTFMLMEKEADDGWNFYVKKGLLVDIDYFSPC